MGRKRKQLFHSNRASISRAVTLYDLRVVSLGIAARIAHVSVSEFMDALGQAGISVFQYSAEEALAEAAELEESSRRVLANVVESAASSAPGR